MPKFDTIFKDIFARFSDHDQRIKNFETWEPAEPEGGFWINIGAHRSRSTNAALPGGVWQNIPFDIEVWDTDASMSSSIYTAPRDGKYLFITNLNYVTFIGTFQVRFSVVYAAGGGATVSTTFDGAKTHANFSSIISLSTGDRVFIQSNPTLGTNLVGGVSIYHSFWQVQWIGD